MIKFLGYTPYGLWYNPVIEKLEKEKYPIFKDTIIEILEDCLYAFKNITVEYTNEGYFKIIALEDNANIEAAGKELNDIIAEYELEDY